MGGDLEAAKTKLKERNLADRVLAVPIVGKRRLVKYLQAVDVVIEQFVLGYYGGSGLEAMACGKPVIMRLERDQYDALIQSGAPPTLDAEDADGVQWELQFIFIETSNLRRMSADRPANGSLEHNHRCDVQMFIMCFCVQ